MHPVTRRTVIGAASSALVVATLGLAAAPAASAATDIKIGTIPANTNAAIPQYAISSGIFARNGLNATLVIQAAPPMTIASLASGQIQFGVVPTVSVVQSYVNAGINLRIVAPGAGTSTNDAIRQIRDPKFALATSQGGVCVKPDSGITSYKGLAGKRVAVPARRLQAEISLAIGMKREKADPATVSWAAIPLQQSVAAVKNGQVDAAYVLQPFKGQCIAEGLQVWGAPEAELTPKGGQTGVYVTTADYAKANPQVVKAFQKSIYEAQSYAMASPANMLTVLKSLEPVTKTTVNPNDKAPYFFTSLTKAQIDEVKKSLLAAGYLNRDFDTNGLILPQYRK